MLHIRELSFNPSVKNALDEQRGGVLLEMVVFEARYDHFFSGLRGGHAAIFDIFMTVRSSSGFILSPLHNFVEEMNNLPVFVCLCAVFVRHLSVVNHFSKW